ncbi:MAG: LysR family transcriptional regulator [Sphingobium sp.]|nr:LysR family transcriptional regulator [Sphingobium sp.]
MLERYLLRYFLAVVDQGNFSRAAMACHVSQPTLSAGIAKLEQLLGDRLFLRSNQRVQLTDGGTRFLGHARRIEAEFNFAAQALTSTAAKPTLRLGILSSIPGDLVAQAVAQARPQDSHVFELIHGTERDLVSALARGRVDAALGLVGRGAARFLEESVVEEGYALAMPDGHPLSGAQSIAGEALADNVMIVRRHCEVLSETSRYFTERGVRPHFAMRTTNDERVLQMVAAGIGVTVMPQSYRHPGVVQPRLSGFDVQRTLGWQFGHATEHLSEARPAIMAALEQSVRERIADAA